MKGTEQRNEKQKKTKQTHTPGSPSRLRLTIACSISARRGSIPAQQNFKVRQNPQALDPSEAFRNSEALAALRKWPLLAQPELMRMTSGFGPSMTAAKHFTEGVRVSASEVSLTHEKSSQDLAIIDLSHSAACLGMLRFAQPSIK